MAASGFTPISLYHSSTAAAVPVNTNLVNGELAINITDGKLYYKDNGGVVRLLASNATSAPVTSISFGTTGLTPSVATDGAISVAGTLVAANGGTGITSPGASGNVLTSNGTAWTSGAPPSAVVNYPQNIQTADYTLVLGDAGKQIYHPASDANIRTFTIPSNASVAFPIGTTVLFVVENGGTYIRVAINSDTLVTTQGITGTKIVLPGNVLTCIKTTATKWVCYLANDIPSPQQQIAVAFSSSPFIAVWAWDSTGFGLVYSNPSTLPTGAGRSVAFSPSGSAIAVAHATTPFLTAYPWSATGFGVKYANPSVTPPPATGNGVVFSPSGADIAVAHNSTPFITAYAWSSSGFGTKYTDPGTLPSSTGNGVAFSPSGADIAVAHAAAPFIAAYPWSGSGFGTKYTDPGTFPPSTGRSVAFSPSGADIAVAHSNSPYITAYPWSGSGFGTKYTNPGTLPGGTGNGVAFSPSGADIAVAHTSSPQITAYPWSGSGFGTKYTDPGTLPASVGNGVAFSQDGSAIAVAHTSTPFITAYPWSGSGFGTKYTNPSTLPTNDGLGVAFNSF